MVSDQVLGWSAKTETTKEAAGGFWLFLGGFFFESGSLWGSLGGLEKNLVTGRRSFRVCGSPFCSRLGQICTQQR
jgi:hypothetical protein